MIMKNVTWYKTNSLIVVIDLVKSFRGGKDLNLTLDNISDAVLLVCRCTWAERTITTQLDYSIFISFYQLKVFFIHELLYSCGDCFFWEVGTHPNVVFLQLVRIRSWVVMKINGSCNALKCLKPSGWIVWVNSRLCNGWVHLKRANLTKTPKPEPCRI